MRWCRSSHPQVRCSPLMHPLQPPSPLASLAASADPHQSTDRPRRRRLALQQCAESKRRAGAPVHHPWRPAHALIRCSQDDPPRARPAGGGGERAPLSGRCRAWPPPTSGGRRWLGVRAGPMKLVSARLGRRQLQEAIRSEARFCPSRASFRGARGGGRGVAQEPSLGRPAPIRARLAQGRSARRRWLLEKAAAGARATATAGACPRSCLGGESDVGGKLSGGQTSFLSAKNAIEWSKMPRKEPCLVVINELFETARRRGGTKLDSAPSRAEVSGRGRVDRSTDE